MSRPNPAILLGFFVAVIGVMVGAALAKGGFYMNRHEGDVMHLADIVLRMADGEWPHLDFMTPLGVLAFQPIVIFIKLGFGMGYSILLSQGLVAVALLPAIWWVGVTRLPASVAYGFGLVSLVMVTALLHGEAVAAVSISMHYNRWAWVISFVAILTAMLEPSGRRSHTIDGVVIGLALAALAMIKMTFFVAFALPVAIALLRHKAYRTIMFAVAAGLAVVAGYTAFAGFDFWLAYLGNLLAVSGSEGRPYPTNPLAGVIGQPAYLGATVMLFMSVIFLRRARCEIDGLVLLLLAPGFFFVTYQNFANDPQWLLLLGIILFSCGLQYQGGGTEERTNLIVSGFIVLTLASPSFTNLFFSPFRHFVTEAEEFTEMIPGNEAHQDMRVHKMRAYRYQATVKHPFESNGLDKWDEFAEWDEPDILNGEELAYCTLDVGMSAWFDVAARDLEQAGFGGKVLFNADIFNSFWLYGDFDRLPHAAPWYYYGLPGIENADYVVVPLCPISLPSRRSVLAEIIETGLQLTEVRRTGLYILLEPEK